MKVYEADKKLLKLIKSLRMAKHRKEARLYTAEGEKLVLEAINFNEPKYIVCSKSYLQSNKTAFDEVYSAEDGVFNSLCETKTPQGILAVLEIKEQKITANSGVIVALENVQDPLNVGTIIRTADAFGAKGIILSNGCADLYSQKVLRGTMGSNFHIPTIKADDFISELQGFKEEGFKIIAGDLNGKTDLDLPSSCVLIIGNEGNGISGEVRELCDYLWKIPMSGKAESLNASVAAGIMLYNLAK